MWFSYTLLEYEVPLDLILCSCHPIDLFLNRLCDILLVLPRIDWLLSLHYKRLLFSISNARSFDDFVSVCLGPHASSSLTSFVSYSIFVEELYMILVSVCPSGELGVITFIENLSKLIRKLLMIIHVGLHDCQNVIFKKMLVYWAMLNYSIYHWVNSSHLINTIALLFQMSACTVIWRCQLKYELFGTNSQKLHGSWIICFQNKDLKQFNLIVQFSSFLRSSYCI